MQLDLYKKSIAHDDRQFHIRYTLTVQLNPWNSPTRSGFAKLRNIKREHCNHRSAPLFALIELVLEEKAYSSQRIADTGHVLIASCTSLWCISSAA